MINGHDFYAIVTAMVPLYVAMFLAYGSVKWWNIFTPDQCSGINRFVAIFAVPLLSFHFISMNDPYTMNFHFLAADALQKIIILLLLALWAKFTKTGTLEWLITIFSLSTLPNTLVIGIPLLSSMYGDFSSSLMVQVVVMQCIIWYTLLLFFFEFRGAKTLIMERFPESGADIGSIKVDSDVVSLDAQDLLETEVEIGYDGKLHVNVRKSNASSRKSIGVGSLSGMEIYSLNSSAIQTPRGSNFNQSDFYSIMGFPGGRLSNSEENLVPTSFNISFPRSGLYHASQNMTTGFPAGKLETGPVVTKVNQQPRLLKPPVSSKPQLPQNEWQNRRNNVDVHMFARSSSAPMTSEVIGQPIDLRPAKEHSDQHGAKETLILVSDEPQNSKTKETEESGKEKSGRKERMEVAEQHPIPVEVPDEVAGKQMPSASVMSRLIVTMVWRKLVRNPNTYASIIGLIWSLLSFRWHLVMPKIIGGSISLISDAGLGMAMFSLGLFMALQPKIIACGRSKAMLAMVAKFLIGPMVMAVAALIVGLHGTLLRVSIVQATLSVGIVPFVFAKEYNVHPTILSTSVIFGMLITVPITLCYYIVLLQL